MKKRAYKYKLSIQEFIILLLALMLGILVLGLLASIILIVVPMIILYLIVESNIKNRIARKIIWITYFVIALFLLIKNLKTIINTAASIIIMAAIIWIILKKELKTY